MQPATRVLIQVVPKLTPGRCGISDPAIMLAGELQSSFGFQTAFAVVNSNERCEVPYPVAYCRPSELLENCVALSGGRPAALLVHMSGYGYSVDGAPVLLAESLETIKRSGQFGIAVYFHENFAVGPPWKSAFWHTRRQQRAIRRVIAVSDLIATNTERHAEWLSRESLRLDGVPVEYLSVFSTAGETEDPTPSLDRDAAIVVFGLPGTRHLAYRMLAKMKSIGSILGIEEILDIGPECETPREVNGIHVKRIGMLTVEQLSVVFSRARFGFASHPAFCLAKSSVFASYCALGTIPVVAEPFAGEFDGLRDGTHLVSVRTAAAVRRSELNTCSRAAWNWYMAHRLSVHAQRYAKWMGDER